MSSIKVRIIKQARFIAGAPYQIGDVVEVGPDLGSYLCGRGLAEPVVADETRRAVAKKPETRAPSKKRTRRSRSAD